MNDEELRGKVVHILGYCMYTNPAKVCEHLEVDHEYETQQVDDIMSLLATAIADTEREARISELEGLETFHLNNGNPRIIIDEIRDRLVELRTQAAKPELEKG